MKLDGCYLIIYDIVDNRKRCRLVEALKDYGSRVQKSVFECRLSHAHYRDLHARITKIINHEQDSVIIYPLCSACLRGRRPLGVENEMCDQNFMVL